MKIMTGTVLFTLLMMPAAVIADVTHKVSGNVTITKYQEGDTFSLSWNVSNDGSNKMMVDEILEVEGNGTIPFELSCESGYKNIKSPKGYIKGYLACDNEANLCLSRNGANNCAASTELSFD
jgi:hypothetical protein